MTNREFYTAIANHDGIPSELADFAAAALKKMDERNAARSSKPSKTAIANEPIKTAIVEWLAGKSEVAAADVGAGVEITTQKASALLRQLCADGVVVATEVKVPKKGKVKGYTLAK